MRKLNKKVWPYAVAIINYDKNNEIESWCKLNIGRRFNDYYSYDMMDSKRVFSFRDEQALLVFKLTWGNYVKKISS